MFLSRLAGPIFGVVKNLRLISNVNITKCLNSTTTNDTSNNTNTNTINENKNAQDPIEDYENLTNNETTENTTHPHSAATEQQINPFEVAQANNSKYFGWQPNKETHSLLMIDGVPYNRLHTVYINATKNNTLIALTDHTGLCLYSLTAGSCGFKNSKKSTAIAGQAAGLAISDNIKRRGIKNIRVMLKGFGNGRLPALKALQMSKLQVISITDQTPIPLMFAKPPRPPVKRRI